MPSEASYKLRSAWAQCDWPCSYRLEHLESWERPPRDAQICDGGSVAFRLVPTVAEGKNRKKCASVSTPPRRKEDDMTYQTTPFTGIILAVGLERRTR